MEPGACPKLQAIEFRACEHEGTGGEPTLASASVQLLSSAFEARSRHGCPPLRSLHFHYWGRSDDAYVGHCRTFLGPSLCSHLEELAIFIPEQGFLQAVEEFVRARGAHLRLVDVDVSDDVEDLPLNGLLGALSAHCPNLDTLALRQGRINDAEGLERTVQAMQKLEQLMLDSPIAKAAASKLIEGAAECPCLSDITLKSTSADKTLRRTLRECLKDGRFPALDALGISASDVTPKAMRGLLGALAANTTLSSLILDNMNDVAVDVVVQALKRPGFGALRELGLEPLRRTRRGLMEVLEALGEEWGAQLEVLHLSNFRAGEKEFEALGRVLSDGGLRVREVTLPEVTLVEGDRGESEDEEEEDHGEWGGKEEELGVLGVDLDSYGVVREARIRIREAREAELHSILMVLLRSTGAVWRLDTNTHPATLVRIGWVAALDVGGWTAS